MERDSSKTAASYNDKPIVYAMPPNVILKRTTASDDDFQTLVRRLDNELWNELKEDQATYDQYNKVADINTAVVVYAGGVPAACGCFKPFGEDAVEIKRMYVQKAFRGKGLSKMVLQELETWAEENGARAAVLETSIRFKAARSLYEKSGYGIIPNYPPYTNLAESVCMRKEF